MRSWPSREIVKSLIGDSHMAIEKSDKYNSSQSQQCQQLNSIYQWHLSNISNAKGQSYQTGKLVCCAIFHKIKRK
jgi:hypothetical protein